MLEEDKKVLPELVIPKLYPIPEGRELDNLNLLLLSPDDKGWLTVQFNDGTETKITKLEHITKLFKGKYNWTFSRLGEWDCLFKVFTVDQLSLLEWWGEVEVGDYTLRHHFGTNCISLTRQGNTRTTKYLVNTAGYCTKSYNCTTLEELETVTSKLIRLNKIIPISLVSFASTVKDLLIDSHQSEFYLPRKLDKEDIHYALLGYKGPRQESRFIGTLPGTEAIDLKKAYLNALATCPTLETKKCVIRRDSTYYPTAHPGSIYTVEVNVPRTYSTFCPIPVRSKQLGGVVYPHGSLVTTVSKPYIEILMEQGDIPFKILKSLQVIPLKLNYFPFKETCEAICYLEDAERDNLYPINVKALHFTMVGHFLHYHQELTKSGNIVTRTSVDFNPFLANAMQGIVAKEIWKESQKRDTAAIRVDALTGKNLGNSDRFKKTPNGLSTFLTPTLKDNPGESFYRVLMEKYRDAKAINLRFTRRSSLSECRFTPSKIGEVVNRDVYIPPSAGNRSIVGTPPKRVGDLLDRSIETVIPHTTQVRGKSYLRGGDTPLWIADYVRLILQTPTSMRIDN